ncbi:cystatin-A2-like [Phyllobates terribilis]|uniref:cystatin-A2-like n=1 Tax=Phyllobates terribilis TaxID=111132 RepID=UPI003CCB1273
MNPEDVVGGIGAEKPADAEVQDVCKKVKPQFIKQSGKNADTFQLLSYKTQVVSGKNYFVKVDIGDDFCHLKISAPHSGKDPELLGWQCGKTKNDAITSF